jgi:hypothetical protein
MVTTITGGDTDGESADYEQLREGGSDTLTRADEGGLDVDTANSAASADSLDGGPAEWKTQNGITVNGNHAAFDSPQEAVDFAGSNDFSRVVLPPGGFGRLEIPYDGLLVSGAGSAKSGAHRTLVESGGADALRVQGSGVVVENVAAEVSGSTAGHDDAITVTGSNCTLRDCAVLGADEHGIHIFGTQNHVTGCRVLSAGERRLVFGVDSVDCTAIGNQGLPDPRIFDGGTGNVYSGLNA